MQNWDVNELKRCGALNTGIHIDPNLSNNYHPIFKTWKHPSDDVDVLSHLTQSTCLATRLLATNPALHWIANLVSHDVFRPDYHGRLVQPQSALTLEREGRGPFAIVRYEHSKWAKSLKDEARNGRDAKFCGKWASKAIASVRHTLEKDALVGIDQASLEKSSGGDVEDLLGLKQISDWEGELQETWKRSARLRLINLKPYVTWILDDQIWTNGGWAGYTCRIPRQRVPDLGKGLDRGGVARGPYGLKWERKVRKRKTRGDEEEEGGGDGVDKDEEGPVRRDCETVEMIWKRDAEVKARKKPARFRPLHVLVMREYTERLKVLEKYGKMGGEEWLCTAFLAAVTMLHEIGHVVYWTDFRSVNEGLTEPAYGPEIDRELGDSFVASIFGGWIPTPIELKRPTTKKRKPPTFEKGLSWKLHATFEDFKHRPGTQSHYSIPIK